MFINSQKLTSKSVYFIVQRNYSKPIYISRKSLDKFHHEWYKSQQKLPVTSIFNIYVSMLGNTNMVASNEVAKTFYFHISF